MRTGVDAGLSSSVFPPSDIRALAGWNACQKWRGAWEHTLDRGIEAKKWQRRGKWSDGQLWRQGEAKVR